MAKRTRARSKSGRFLKGGGTKALTRTRTRTITRYRTRGRSMTRTRRRSRRGGGGSGGVTAGKLAITGLALGALVGSSNMAPKQVTDFVAKIPGAKTFGNVAITGLAIGALGHFTGVGGRFRPWMKAAGVIGLVVAAVKLGTDNTAFKFIGDDDDDDSLMDVDVD